MAVQREEEKDSRRKKKKRRRRRGGAWPEARWRTSHRPPGRGRRVRPPGLEQREGEKDIIRKREGRQE